MQRNDVSDFEQLPTIASIHTGPGSFDTLAVPLLRGRDFAMSDTDAVAIVNDRFVELFLAGIDPIGHRITLRATANDRPLDTTIVGVAQNIRYSGEAPAPVVYLPLNSAPPTAVSIMLRSTIDAAATTQHLRDAVFGVDPNLPVHQVMAMNRVIRDSDWPARVSARLITVLSFIVLLLSTVGLYAVTAHAVNQRAKELGIRIAIGARPAELRRLVLSRAAVQAALGLVFGVVCTYAWNRVFAAAIEPRQFIEVQVLGPIAAILTLATTLACLVPVRKAMRLDPLTILRQD